MAAVKRVDWPECAARLARLLPRERLHPAVLAWAGARKGREQWGVAFSGGPDSLALLLLLWAHWPKRRRHLRALHFDHRLRGAESRADAQFCRRVCAGLGVKFVPGVWAGRHRDASEAEARAARLAFFSGHGRVLWLGHQQDDIAESMLMRLARGSGAAGLAAPRPVQPMPGRRVHLRPLLVQKKTQIVAALKSAGISWREDSTNAGAIFFRNRVRRGVIPAWIKAAERDALAGAALSRELLDEDDAALESWVERCGASDRRGELALARLAGLPRAVIRRALRRWLAAEHRAGELSRQAFDALLAAVERGASTRQSLGTRGFAVIRAGVLRFEANGMRAARFQRRSN